MAYNLDKGTSVYSLYYHFIQVVKYRKKVFTNASIVGFLKMKAREIQRNFPEVKKELWKGMFWSPSYFLATSGQVTLEVTKRYVDSQEVK